MHEIPQSSFMGISMNNDRRKITKRNLRITLNSVEGMRSERRKLNCNMLIHEIQGAMLKAHVEEIFVLPLISHRIRSWIWENSQNFLQGCTSLEHLHSLKQVLQIKECLCVKTFDKERKYSVENKFWIFFLAKF